MNKSIFLVNAHTDTSRKLELLKKTLKAIKHKEFDICLSMNYPITDPEVYELIDYFVYDKQDVQDYADYGVDYITDPGWFYNLDWCTMTIKYNSAYHYNIWRCVYNGLNLINNLGYEFFLRVDGDNVGITTKDIEKFIEIKDVMFEQEKNFFV